MIKPKVFVTRIIPEKGIKEVMDSCETEIWPDEFPPSREILLKKVRGVKGILCLLTDKIDGPIMDAAGPDLKVISNYAVGFDNIDIKDATDRGILVGNTPGVLTETTADLSFALLMAAARRIGEGIDHIRAGNWKTFKPMELLGRDVHHATLGIIGMGRIGIEVARRAKGFDMEILYYDPAVGSGKEQNIGAGKCATINELLQRSDFISLHVPLTAETYHMINASAFERMKETAVLINTSRGPVVDSDALYDALYHGKISCAALDVTDPEPIPNDHKLMGLSNCLIVPHMGSATIGTRGRMALMAVNNLLAGVKGESPEHLVNPEALDHPRWKG
ncbi:MAG TPA: D-glycerate dehydrogenase [Desulfobacteraceae bacterium]|nr:D-glycerate dehydrogenase [Desulfobacteraceae bacterium]